MIQDVIVSLKYLCFKAHKFLGMNFISMFQVRFLDCFYCRVRDPSRDSIARFSIFVFGTVFFSVFICMYK